MFLRRGADDQRLSRRPRPRKGRNGKPDHHQPDQVRRKTQQREEQRGGVIRPQQHQFPSVTVGQPAPDRSRKTIAAQPEKGHRRHPHPKFLIIRDVVFFPDEQRHERQDRRTAGNAQQLADPRADQIPFPVDRM